MRLGRGLRNTWGGLLTVGIFFLLLVILFVLVLYLAKFNSVFSAGYEGWAAFGTYFGGVAAPAISLITLFAVLRTIGLQLEQSTHFVTEAEYQRIAEYKACQLQLLHQQINMYERMIDRYDQEGERLIRSLSADCSAASIAQTDSNLKAAERDVARLIQISVEISLSNFESIEELRRRIASELCSINPVLYATSFS